jgi:ribosome-binding protein aMBF1 (putative translation factor)
MDPPSFVVKSSNDKTSTKKFGSGGNKSSNSQAKKMDDPDFVTTTIESDKSQEIMKTRAAKGLSRKDLATRASVSTKIIEEFETGKAVKSHPQYLKNLLAIRRALGINVQKKKPPKKAPQMTGKKAKK